MTARLAIVAVVVALASSASAATREVFALDLRVATIADLGGS